MTDTIVVNLDRQITSVKLLDDYGAGLKSAEVISDFEIEQSKLMEDLENQRSEFSQTCRMLQKLSETLKELHEKMFAEHKEEIAKLSVEIARKILAQKVQESDYQIESIVKQALEKAPTNQDLVVHLNPEDIYHYQNIVHQSKSEQLVGIKIVEDSNIGRAECIIESPKGIIESFINEHLEQIAKALKKV